MIYYTAWPRVYVEAERQWALAGADGPPSAVRLDGCWKAFDDVVALQPTWLRLSEGSTTLVTGANGAGKSTLLRLVAGAIGPSGGYRVAIGRGLYLVSGDGGRRTEKVAEAVGFAAAVGVGDAGEALGLAGCDRLADRRISGLSGGQRARVTLAVAAAARPAVLCLDEPWAQLDHAGQATLSRVVGALRDRGSAVVLATPTADGGDALLSETLDRVVAIRDGRAEAAG